MSEISSTANSSTFEYYGDYRHVGNCLIINNEHFSESQSLWRRGTELDEVLLTNTFILLGFSVQVENNLSTSDMERVLDKVSEANHSEASCFVCVVLSHGEPGTVLGADNHNIPLRKLTSALTSERCPSLQGKPKLFFFQACRGNLYDSGVETDAVYAQEEDFIGVSDVPERDFLCCYSTTFGYYAWRNISVGSIFIQELCGALKRHRHLEITQILTRVNHQVALYYQSRTNAYDTDKKRQMPCFISRLTKEFYFR